MVHKKKIAAAFRGQAMMVSGLTAFAVSLGMIFCGVSFFVPTGAQAATMSILPATGAYTTGATITARVRVNTAGGQTINALQGALSYPANLLQGLTISRADSFVTIWADEPEFENGIINFAGGRAGGFIGAGNVFNASFRVLDAGSASLQLSNVLVLAHDGNGTNVFESASGASYIARGPVVEPPEPAPLPEPVEPSPEEEPAPAEPEPELIIPPEPGPVSETRPEVISEPTASAEQTDSGSPLGIIQRFFGIGQGEGTAGIVSGAPIGPPECFDGIDNDGDGLVDYPSDSGCGDHADVSEFDSLTQIVQIIMAPIVSEKTAKTVAEAVAKARKSEVYKTLDKRVVNNPVVEEITAKIASPVVVAAAAANASAAISFANLFVYLQWFFTQPFLLLARRRRREWGQVYSSLSKLPVDLALVRLFDAKTNKLLRTRVTDRQGRYLFLADHGSYRLEAIKAGYSFPSALLKSKTADLDFTNLYHGDTIDIAAKGVTLTKNIPVDPKEKEMTPRQVIWRRRKKMIHKTIAWSGPVLAIAAVAINPGPLTVGLLGLQFGFLGLFKRLAEGKQPRSWGMITDRGTGAPLSYALARIFDTEFNKLLETQVTDKSGRYAFLVGKGSFYITIQKQGYRLYKSPPLDLTSIGAQEIVKKDIALEPLAPGEEQQIMGGGIAPPPAAPPAPTEPEQMASPAPTESSQ